MRHQDDYSIRDNYIDNAEHYGQDPMQYNRDQLDEGHVSQGDTSGPDFEYARRGASGGSDFADSVRDNEHEFWAERHLGDEHEKWTEDKQRPSYNDGTWRMVKGRTIRTKRLNQARSRKKS
jgi:hypothetical protein